MSSAPTDTQSLVTRLLAEGAKEFPHQPLPHETGLRDEGHRGTCALCNQPQVLFRDLGGSRPVKAKECSVLLRLALDLVVKERDALGNELLNRDAADRYHAEDIANGYRVEKLP